MKRLRLRHAALLAGLAALVVATGTPTRAQTASAPPPGESARAPGGGSALPQSGSALPPGDGRDLVATACSQCHALNVILSMRNGPTGWRHHVYNMVLRGAQLTGREADTVVDYLSTTLGPGQQLLPGKPVTLPSAPGKDLVETRCGLCHDLERITAAKRGKREWNDVVAAMFDRYGTPAPDEAAAIAAYLGAQFGSD